MRPIVRLTLTASLIAVALVHVAAQPAGVHITTIAPASGGAGDLVTITGGGFGAHNVTILVAGVRAAVVTAAGNRVTFSVPAGVPVGTTSVTATNPGGQSGSIPFEIIGAGLLRGDPSAPALDAITDLPPTAVGADEIESGVIMTRLDVRLAPDATVGEVNAALSGIGAGIASMSRGFPALTIVVPRQPGLVALRALAASLDAAPGFDAALLALVSDDDELPSENAAQLDSQLLATGFPAAWNARNLAVDPGTGECRQPRVPVLIGDDFVRPPPLVHDLGFSFVTFEFEIPNFLPSPPDETGHSTHGYAVTLALGARFNPEARTGANPFSQCLDVTAVQMRRLSDFQKVDRLVRNFPDGKFVVNYSQSWPKACIEGSTVVPCEAQHFGTVIPNAITRAEHTLWWKQRTFKRWGDFVIASSAGNVLDKEPGRIYPALATAWMNSFVNAATLPDPLLGFASSAALWQPTDPAFPSLAATPEQAENLASALSVLGLEAVGGAPNTLKVGSTTNRARYADLEASAFSNLSHDVSAIGEQVLTADQTSVDGTSFSSPQIAGLASYLWLLSPQLRSEPAALTRRAIVDNAIDAPGAPRVADAYAAVLSLDEASTPTTISSPIRLAILDVHADGRFDALDLAAYRFALTDAAGGMVEPATPDYSRYDLNGDGFTGGAQRRARFDLDRTGSMQFGAASYADVTAHIEGLEVQFTEAALTDLEILCYYAYSALYQGGDPATRGALMNGLCGTVITVDVDPSSVTLAAGASQQFAADVSGAADPRVSWTATGGTITSTGLFTAGPAAGTFTVRALSVIDPGAFDDATVTITVAAPPVITGSYDGMETRGLVGNATDVDTRVARWGLFPDNGVFKLIRFFEGTGFFCGTGSLAGAAQCSPLFSITNGQFQGTEPGKTVTGSLIDGRLRFVLQEPCGTDENGHPVTCFASFDGTILQVPVAPTSLDFGSVPVGGTSASQFVTISNNGLLSVPVTVSTGGGFTLSGNAGNPCFRGDTPPLSGFLIPAGFSCSVAVQFSPAIQGSFTSTLTVKVQDGVSPPVSISLSGRTH